MHWRAEAEKSISFLQTREGEDGGDMGPFHVVPIQGHCAWMVGSQHLHWGMVCPHLTPLSREADPWHFLQHHLESLSKERQTLYGHFFSMGRVLGIMYLVVWMRLDHDLILLWEVWRGWISCEVTTWGAKDAAAGSGITAWEQAWYGLCFLEHWRQTIYKLFIAALQRLQTFYRHQGKTLV